MVYEATLVRGLVAGPSIITYYNYSKEGHKYSTCPEPQKPSAIYKINEQSQDLEFTNKELGKKDP